MPPYTRHASSSTCVPYLQAGKAGGQSAPAVAAGRGEQQARRASGKQRAAGGGGSKQRAAGGMRQQAAGGRRQAAGGRRQAAGGSKRRQPSSRVVVGEGQGVAKGVVHVGVGSKVHHRVDSLRVQHILQQ